MSKTLFVAVAVLAVGLASGALIKETNSSNGMINLALAGTAFAPSSYTSAGGIHYITNLNDGRYGNSYSWLQGQASNYGVFAGVKLAGLKTVDGVAFSRDNLGEFSDRASGTYTVQYTQYSSPETISLSTTDDPSTGWVTIGSVTESDPFRKRYSVTPAVQARGVRLVLSDIGMLLDEFEVLMATATSHPHVAEHCNALDAQCATLGDECTSAPAVNSIKARIRRRLKRRCNTPS